MHKFKCLLRIARVLVVVGLGDRSFEAKLDLAEGVDKGNVTVQLVILAFAH